MKMLATLLVGASALILATTAFAQVKKPPAADTQARQVPVASQTTTAVPDLNNPEASVSQPRPLFKIGELPVGVWAPVEPPYDSRMNRDQAGNPVWDWDAF
jgi:hypothetical protein